MEGLINIENRRYIGSKAKLKSWIFSLIEKNCKGDTFADIFAGTGVIGAEASKKFKHIILNDLLYSNIVSYEAFFGKGEFSDKKVKKIIDEYNNLNPKLIEENYFSKNFGDKYFSKENSKIIGYIREDLEKRKNKLKKREYNIILASLIYSIDKIANTVGHYDAYIKKTIGDKRLCIKQIVPTKIKNVSIFQQDANFLSKKIKADVVYIDPPYNSRQYSRFYHLLETLVKWNKKELYGVALKPESENMSEYCTVKAPKVFADLIKNLKSKYIVVSYNNTYNSKSNSSKNKIKLEQIQKILEEKGSTEIHKKSHPFFNSGKTDFDDHQEWLFITKVYDKK
ncbi:MAG: DNA adenine methylase [Candidatus Paceibacterota bacterium]|jgi:adenine-specific DNA-methyltransferase